MLSYEWRELETVCQRISELRDRYTHARRSQNQGLLEGLKRDLALARRQREHLVEHISAHLSIAASEHRHPPVEHRQGAVTIRAGAIVEPVDDAGFVPPL